MNDAFVWQNSYVWKQRGAHFRQGEWLLADRGTKTGTFLDRETAEPMNRLPVITVLTSPIQRT